MENPNITYVTNATRWDQVAECAMCLEPLRDPCALSCGHIFDEICAKKAQQQLAQCPSCREPIKSIVKLYGPEDLVKEGTRLRDFSKALVDNVEKLRLENARLAAALETRFTQHEAELAQLRKQVSRGDEVAGQFAILDARHKAELTQKDAELAQKDAELAQLRQQLNRGQHAVASQPATLDARLKQHEAELAQKDTELAQLKQQLSRAHRAIADQQTTLDARVKQYEAELAQIKQQLSRGPHAIASQPATQASQEVVFRISPPPQVLRVPPPCKLINQNSAIKYPGAPSNFICTRPWTSLNAAEMAKYPGQERWMAFKDRGEGLLGYVRVIGYSDGHIEILMTSREKAVFDKHIKDIGLTPMKSTRTVVDLNNPDKEIPAAEFIAKTPEELNWALRFIGNHNMLPEKEQIFLAQLVESRDWMLVEPQNRKYLEHGKEIYRLERLRESEFRQKEIMRERNKPPQDGKRDR